MSKEIWIYAEITGGRIEPAVYQLITKAKQIAGQQAVVVILAEETAATFETEIATFGPNQIKILRDDRFKKASDAEIADALAQLVAQEKPNSLLFAATSVGRSIAPRLQAKCQTGLTADCLDLRFEDDLLIQTKPTYGDSIMCEITCPTKRPQMATVRPNIFKAQLDATVTPTITELPFTFHPEAGITVEQESMIVRQAANLADADRIIALGRGVHSQKAISTAQTIATKMGGMLGVSRPLTDDAQFSHEDQIGQSGNTVAPKLLLNVGISGAVQYLVGIQNAGKIVSVNTDPNAPIFADSDYGWIGDGQLFLDTLAARFK